MIHGKKQDQFLSSRPWAKQLYLVSRVYQSVFRSALLRSSMQYLPNYHSYVAQCYGTPSYLLCEEMVMQSRSGIQQGDPLGPLLYCLATLDAHRDLKSELKEAYLDDDVLSGAWRDVLDDLVCLEDRLRQLGLDVNVQKCEVLFFGGSDEGKDEACRQFLLKFPALPRVSAKELSYLGAPLLNDAFVPCFQSTHEKVTNLLRRTKVLPMHQAYFLARNCLGPVKVVYLLRSTRAYCFPEALLAFDEKLRVSLSEVFNTRFSDVCWFQATLPIMFAGMGIRLTEGLALPAFLASAFSVTALVQSLTPFNTEEYIGNAMGKWKKYSGCEEPLAEERNIQRSWDLPLARATFAQISAELDTDPTSKARLLAVCTRESSAWLNKYPVQSYDGMLDDDAFRTGMGLRLGADVTAPHRCVCGDWADEKGHHALACNRSLGRIPKHSALNVAVKRALAVAEVYSRLEPAGYILEDGRRPDGMTITPYASGKKLFWDSTVVCTVAPSNIAKSTAKAGGAAECAETSKVNKYQAVLPNDLFVPLGFETFGSWGPAALRLLSDIAKKQFQVTGERRSMQFLRERISLEVQRGNALCVLGTLPEFRNPVF